MCAAASFPTLLVVTTLFRVGLEVSATRLILADADAGEVVRAFGAIPVLITVIVDRGGTCGAMAEAAGVPFRPMLTAPDLGFPFGS